MTNYTIELAETKVKELLDQYPKLLDCYPLLWSSPKLSTTKRAYNKAMRIENFVFVSTNIITLANIVKDVWRGYTPLPSAPTYHLYELNQQEKEHNNYPLGVPVYILLFDKDYFRHGEYRMIQALTNYLSFKYRGEYDYYNSKVLRGVSFEYQQLCNMRKEGTLLESSLTKSMSAINDLIQDRIEKDKVEYGK